MKNRLQFNRIPTIFSGETRTQGGEEVWVSGREQAKEALENYIRRGSFIPLIGEPIAVRYTDDKGDRQTMLAIGKSTGTSLDMVNQREYHIIDTAGLQEEIDVAVEMADEAIELASAATKDTTDYLIILKNMIMSGIGLSDGTYFDNNGRWDRDPSQVGLYDQDKVNGTFYLREAESFMDADKKLDAAIVGTNAWFNGRCDDIQGQLNDEKGYRKALKLVKINNDKFEELGIGDDVRDAYFLTHHKPNSTEPYEDPQEGDVIIKVYKETVTWDDLANFSGITESYFKNIIEAEGLKDYGTYDHERAHDSVNFKDAFDAFTADELLDKAISELSANTIAADQAVKEELNDKIDELSANTMAADQELADRISELEGNKVLGVSAITTEQLENGDTRVSLVINEEDDKVLSQNTLGLKAKVTLDYVSADKKIYLKGKNDIVISEIDATDFIKDGMLDSANVIVATEEDHEQYPELIPGKTYIKLLFNTDAEQPGKANPVFISADDLVDIYTVNPYSGGTSMKIEDYLITLVIDNAEGDGTGLASWAYASSISAVTNNIIKAAGLTAPGEEGKYPGHSGVTCYYISAATSLDNADVILDNALWATSGLNADVSNRVDELSAVTREFSAHTVEALSALSNSVDERIESGITIISGVVENYVEEMLSGLNFDEIYEYVDDSVEALSGALLDYIIDNEEVTAAALNDLNKRTRYFETHYTGEYIPITNYTIACGTTEEELLLDENDSINEAFGKIQKQILDNEESVAAGLNDLNERVQENSEAIARATGVTALSAAVMSFSSATNNKFNIISGDVINNRTDINILSGMIGNASAQTSGVLTINANGVEQGKYSPSASTTIDLEIIQEVTGADVLLTGYELSSATTEEELAVVATDNVNEAFGKIQKQIYDDEEVIAASLNDLDERITNLEICGGTENFFDGAEYVPSAKTIVFKHGDIIKATIDATDFLEELSAGTVQGLTYLSGVIKDNELVTAAALNDLNDRIRELSGNTPDMSNYYAKNETYNQAEVNNLISGATLRKYQTASTLTDLALNEFLTIVKIDGNTTLSIGNSLPTLPANGVAERHVIIENTGNTDAVVTLASDSRVKLTMNNLIAIDRNGGIGELNALITYDGSAYTIYVITT